MIYMNVSVLIMDLLAKGSFTNLKLHDYSLRLNLTGTLMTPFCLELDFFPLLLFCSLFLETDSVTVMQVETLKFTLCLSL